jgi:hypothetical protein
MESFVFTGGGTLRSKQQAERGLTIERMVELGRVSREAVPDHRTEPVAGSRNPERRAAHRAGRKQGTGCDAAIRIG